MKPNRIVMLLHDQYSKLGGINYSINEPISILSHSTQSALWIIQNVPEHNPNTIVSALLHDYGHITQGPPLSPDKGINDYHEIIGSDALTLLGFPLEVTEPIRLHVKAKRYLATINPSYTLSVGSHLSLKLQGGLMTHKELKEFEKNKFFKEALLLRHADDSSKDDIIETNTSILTFSKLIQKVLNHSV